MTPELRYYQDPRGRNFEAVVVVTDPNEVDEMMQDMKLVSKVPLPDVPEGADWTSWPTDRLLIQER